MKSSTIKYLIVFGICFLFHFGTMAQVGLELNEFPDSLQLYARDVATNFATVSISGTDDSNQLQSVELNVFREGILVDNQIENLTYNAGIASFNLQYALTAELANYTFELLSNDINGLATVVEVATDVVAGDVYVIDGQSNAECTLRSSSAAAYQNDFIRVFSSGTQYSDQLLATSKWYIGNVDVNRNVNGNTGQWGAKLAAEIISNQQIPVAIFNGAHGGTPISFHEKNDLLPEDLETNYGRLLYRLNYTNLADAVRAVFWYQGETDANQSMQEQTYYDLWEQLYLDWKTDFINAEQFYIHQIRLGCNGTPEKIVEVQSAQFKLAQDFTDVQVTTAKGIPFHTDNCHYDFVGGSEEIGNRFYRLVDRDFYNNTSYQDIDAPQPALAYYSDVNQITFELADETDSYNFELGTEQYFGFSDPTNSILNVSYDGNYTYIFDFVNPVANITSMTFFGFGGPGITTPSLKNANNIGMVSFKDFPVVDCLSLAATESVTELLCFGDSSGEAEVIVSGGSAPYQVNWSNGSNTNAINNLAAAIYSYTIEDVNGCSQSDSVLVTEPSQLALSAIWVDESIGGANDGVINLAVSGGTAPYTYDWSNGATWQDINNLAPGTYTVDVTDANNCIATYSVTILAGTPPCVIPSAITAGNIQNTSATLSWTPDANVSSYLVEYRESGFNGWTSFTSGYAFAILSNLNACTDYEVRIRASCVSGMSSVYSAIYTFTTDGCVAPCSTISGLFSQNVTNSSAFLVWDIVPNATYTMYYRAVGNASWFSYPTQFPLAILFTLPACTDFEWYVEVNCVSGQVSGPSPTANFTTIGANCKNNINEVVKSHELKIHPNPASTFSYISFPSSIDLNVKVKLFGMDGRNILEAISFHPVADDMLKIDFRNVPTGIYNIQIINTEEIFNQSIYINKSIE